MRRHFGFKSGTARWLGLGDAAVAWFALIVAGVFEVVWAVALKQSAAFTRLGPSVITVAALAASLGLLSIAMRSLPLGTAYIVWTGIGAVGAFLVGVAFFGESTNPLRLMAAAFIVGGVLVMKLTSAE
jgi:quaternary ammonium compound-resistance protein SugE